MEALREIQKSFGAIFTQSLEVPLSFGNDPLAFEAAQSGVALCDRSHWGILAITGEDRLRFLHNQSTNDIQTLQPGQGCETVFVTATARTIDLAIVYATDQVLLTLVSPHRRQLLLQGLDKYIFPMDRVALQDYSSDYAVFTLLGKHSSQLLEKLGVQLESVSESLSKGDHQLVTLKNWVIRLAVGTGLALEGYTIFAETKDAAAIWDYLVSQGATATGEQVWEQLRIHQGRPKPDQELTEDYNPLEAGLWQTISFDKGCYIGQETIARLNTYKGVKQRLFGMHLTDLASPGTIITVQGEKIGVLTSCIEINQQFYGLGYIRTKAGGRGLIVDVGDVEGKVVEVPYLTYPIEPDPAKP